MKDDTLDVVEKIMIAATKEAKINDIHLMMSIFSVYAKFQNSASLFSLNRYAEDLFCELLNHIYGWHLENINYQSPNASNVDLVDRKGKIVVQVTSERRLGKLKRSLSEISACYNGFTFYFLCFNLLPPPKWEKGQFDSSQYVHFNAETNILSIEQLAIKCAQIDDEQLEKVWNTLSSYVRGDLPENAVKADQINKWIIASTRAYKRFDRWHQNGNMKQLDEMVQSEHSTHPYLSDLPPELLTLKGKNHNDTPLIKEADRLRKICQEFSLITRVCSEQEVQKVHKLSEAGKNSILSILIRLGQKSGISEQVVLEFFFQYLNS